MPAQDYQDYINRMRQLRQQRDAGTITQEQAIASQPQPAGMEPVNTRFSTMKSWGENIADTAKRGLAGRPGQLGIFPQMASNVAQSARAIWRGADSGGASAPSARSAQPARPGVMPTYSTPSGGMVGPQMPSQSSLGMVTSMREPNMPIYGGAITQVPGQNRVYTAGQIANIGATQSAGMLDESKPVAQFGATNATQNATAAERYRKFMEGSLARGKEMQARTGQAGPAMPLTRSQIDARVQGERGERMQAAGMQQRQAENEATRQLERDVTKMKADADVKAAEAGKPSPKSEKAAMLKELVALWENASDAERLELWPKIQALTADDKTTEKPVAKDAAGKEVYKRGGKYVYADGTEWKAA